MTKILKQDDIQEVIQLLKNENVVSFPTETVFGLGVIYNSESALKKLIEAKNRDASKAITLMVEKKEDIDLYAYVSDDARKIINAFMPGMITLIFKKKECVSDLMTNGKETIGIRIPDHSFVLDLLKNAGPLLVTSANMSNASNTTNEREVLNQLCGRIDAVVEGNCLDTIASTVVDVSSDEIKILREGKISYDEIMGVLK